MRQVFLIAGMPDKVIAFDELPEDLTVGLDLIDCSRYPRDFREFVGLRERTIKVTADRDPFTGKMREYPPLVQKGPFAFSVDFELGPNKDKWAEIASYTQRNAPKEFRLKDKLEDMAKLVARDANSEWGIEVEEIVVIPLPKADGASVPAAAPEPARDALKSSPPVLATPAAPALVFKCDKCEKEFSKKQALRMHTTVKHAEPKEAAKV